MSYGIQFFNASGNLALDIDECFPQLVYNARVSGGFSGTISIPNFDEVRGMFYVAFCIQKLKVGGDGRMTIQADGSTDYTHLGVNPASLPTLTWNNATKVMSVTPANLPSNWPGMRENSDYFLRCIHFRQRVTV